MIADFLCMFSVEEGNSTGCKRGNNSFYIENATACFGLYSYISLGAAVDPQTYNFSTTYSYFRDFASLDQFYGICLWLCLLYMCDLFQRKKLKKNGV